MFRPDVQHYTQLPPVDAQREEGEDINSGPLSSTMSTSRASRRVSDCGVKFVDGSIDLGFVEGDRFQSFIGVIILSNVVVLWGETDSPHLLVWAVCDNLFLVIFLAEIVLRLLHQKPAAYYSGKDKAWAYLDTAIVLFGIFDLWMMPLYGSEMGGSSPMCMRFLRLMRLLRLLRVFRVFPQLMTFITALKDMFATFVWIFAVLAMFILTFAISLTHLLGHGEALGSRDVLEQEKSEALHTVLGHFRDVPTSAFTLFQLTTIDNWDDIAYPLIELNPWWRLFFVFFIAFASWSMISVLTAVASNKMIAATADRKETESRVQEKRYQAFIDFLRESFVTADSDGNGVLDMEEFSTMISQDFVHKRMKELGVYLSRKELFKAWEMLDIDESGELTIDEFVTGLSTLQEGLATKHMVSVDYSLKRITLKTEARMEQISKEAQELASESEHVHQIIKDQWSSPLHPELSNWMKWRAHSDFGPWMRQNMPETSVQFAPEDLPAYDGPSDVT
mmetsp:Transcript_79534/g.200032  ORF Transcript_79534/g.200032 Transcript_79534/m.200032 type:complete len:505 (-) Transcript_79534:69-1583(-)